MTTVDAPNIHNVAVEGTFDDCQDLVKALFADEAFRDALHLSAVNSINWARVDGPGRLLRDAALRARRGRTRPVAFAVPTGQLRQHLRRLGRAAAWALPDRRSSSSARTATTSSPGSSTPARWQITEVVPTLSPSMDIQVSSNFERLLFELNGRDGGAHRRADGGVPASGSPRPRGRSAATMLRASFAAASIDERATTAHDRRDATRRSGIVVDPHTAVGIGRGDAGRPRSRRADRRARDRPSGEVPRRRRDGHRRAARAARPPRRPVRPTRALRGRGERRRRGTGAHHPGSCRSSG